jgi:hypothetical protein
VESSGDAESFEGCFKRRGVGIADAEKNPDLAEFASLLNVFEDAERDIFDFMLEGGCGENGAPRPAELFFEVLFGKS